jgi:hypothetical protein
MANEFKIKKGLIVTGASGGTVVDVQGSQGQLFSVTDDLSGSIFAVSDISGVPILDVNSSGAVNIDGTLIGSSSATFVGTVTAPTFLGDLNGTINTATTGVTQVAGNNSTKIATTAYADAAAAAVPVGDYLPLTGGTMTGSIAMSNQNITGVNQITINDPGEGIVFQGTTNVNLYVIDDTTDSIVNFDNASEIRRDGVRVADVPYVASRSQQLMTNYNGLLGNNYNFPGWTFDGEESNYSPGSFKFVGSSGNSFTSEFMAVDTAYKYKMSLDAKTLNGVGRYYCMTLCYDVDQNQINANNHMYRANTSTTLAVALNPGDTTITLAGTGSNWYDGGTAGVSTHVRSLIIWEYTNSFGYTYPPETYSRLWYTNVWDPNNINGNVITLRTAWTGPSYPVGTRLSNGNAGASYKYNVMANTLLTTDWVQYSGFMDGVDLSGNNVGGKFPPGTAKIKMGFLPNYNAGSTGADTIWITNFNVGIDIVLTKGDQSIAGAKTFTTVPVVGTMATSDNSTSAASTAWVTSKVTSDLGNYLPLAGGTMTGVTQFNDHTQHGDQVSAKWGAGNDLTIQHNATNSAIANSVGNLYISNHADDKDIIFECDNGSGASVSYLTLDGSTTDAYFSNPGNVGIGTTNPTAKLHVDGDLIITDTPQGQGDFLTVNPISGKVTTVSSKDISFGEAYINNYRSRVLDYGGTYFPTGAAGNIAKHKTNNLFNLMSMMLLPGGVFSGKITAAKPKTGVDFTWTRTTVANYTNEEGVITEAPIATPRIDYANNSNGEILIEPTRTNLVPNSGTGDYGNGPGSELTVPGPNGIYNSAIVPVPNNGSDRYQYTIPSGTYNDGDVFTYSWYRRRLSTPITTAYLGDLQLNVLVNCTQTGDTVQIESNISGFDRFSAEVTLTLGNTNATVRAYFGNVVGTGNSSVAYFGHQLELGDFAPTLINTTGSAATRDNDYMIVNNLSDTIFQGMVGQGGMYMDFDYKREGGSDGLRFYDENNITPRVYLYQGVTGISDSWNSGSFTLNQTSGNKIGYMFTSTTSAVYCANGANVVTSSPTAAAALDTPLDTLYIDGNQNLIRIRELSMFTQMTSTQLVTLTSL